MLENAHATAYLERRTWGSGGQIRWRRGAAARDPFKRRRFDNGVGEVPKRRDLFYSKAHGHLVVGYIKIGAVLVPKKHLFGDHPTADIAPILPRVVKNGESSGNIELVSLLIAEWIP